MFLFRSAGKGHFHQHPGQSIWGISGHLLTFDPYMSSLLLRQCWGLTGALLEATSWLVEMWPGGWWVGQSFLEINFQCVCLRANQHGEYWSLVRCIGCLLAGVSFSKPLTSELCPVILVNNSTSTIMRTDAERHLGRVSLALLHIL